MTELLKTIRNKIRGETGTRIVVILGLAGMALILFSGMFTGGEKPSPQNESAVRTAGYADTDRYRDLLESRLTALLSQMDGIHTVKVMVTLSGSAEQIYAEEVKSSRNDRGSQSQANCVITKSGGNESALIAETRYPAVVGAAVLCTAGDHAAVQERITRAVSTVLGIPASSVFVGKTGSI